MNSPASSRVAASEVEKLALDGARHVAATPGRPRRTAPGYRRRPASTRITGTHGGGRPRAAASRMWLLVREGSMARTPCAPAASSRSTARRASRSAPTIAIPMDIADSGHIQRDCAKPSQSGSRPRTRCSWRRITRRSGTGCPDRSDRAGLCGGPSPPADLVSFRAANRSQARSADRGRPASRASRWVRQSVRIAPVAPSDFAIPWDGAASASGDRPDQDQVVTSHSRASRPWKRAAPSPTRSATGKIAVFERHLSQPPSGARLRRRVGAQRGALASSVAHDAHNSSSWAWTTVTWRIRSRARRARRGIVAVEERRVLAECPLPVAGLLSDAPLADVVAQSRACNTAAQGLGGRARRRSSRSRSSRFSVIPHLKITDRGLVTSTASSWSRSRCQHGV